MLCEVSMCAGMEGEWDCIWRQGLFACICSQLNRHETRDGRLLTNGEEGVLLLQGEEVRFRGCWLRLDVVRQGNVEVTDGGLWGVTTANLKYRWS